MKDVCKVVRLQLNYLYDEQNKPKYPYEELTRIQQLTCRAKNRTIQACWEWENFQAAFRQEHGAYPNSKEHMENMTFDGYVNRILKDEFQSMYSQNLTCAIRSASKAFRNAQEEMRQGRRSVLSYREDCPVEIHNQRIKLCIEKQKYQVSLSLFSKDYKKEKQYADSYIKFELYRLGGSQKAIVDRCMSGEYKIGESELIYNRKKRCWFLNLTYRFTPESIASLDPEKIMGVDLGIQCVAYMGFNFCEDRFFIGRSEVEQFRLQTESRKRDLQRQGKYCGDGRIGHGYATRNKPILKISDKISRFRDTANHKYSRYIVQTALKYGCGTIQMEDLKEIRNGTENKFLKDWTYFDLRTKIKYKAEECGIELKLVNPQYTSQRCSQCGYIDKQNRPKEEKGQAFFQCMKCGFSVNADYNASVNLATKDIDKIIQKELRAKSKQTQEP